MTNSPAPKKGVLLVNLGSPDSPEEADVRRYLEEFLMDKYVIDSPYPIRWLTVYGAILPRRPARSAEAYRKIWWQEGSPLVVLGQRLREAVAEKVDLPVALGMRYGAPSMQAGIEELLAQGVTEILMIPLYPQYATSTSRTVEEKAAQILASLGNPAHLETLPPFYAAPGYIEALAEVARPHLEAGVDHIMLSYHGVPERQIVKADPTGGHCLRSGDCCAADSAAHATCYRHQAFQTTALLVDKLGLEEGKYSVAFQSRLGRAKWLAPYASQEIARLARAGVKRLVVVCPSFAADCLETLEEIAMEGRETFLENGGEDYAVVEGLNVSPRWVEALASWIVD